jgi:molybdate transport system substrate-binding protein
MAALLLPGCGPREGARPTLTLFAAASLREVADESAALFAAREGVEVVVNTAGSNALAQQIRAGGTADVFLSADGLWVDFLEAAGRVRPQDRRPFLANRLVVIGHRTAQIELAGPGDLAGEATKGSYRLLAVAHPEAVPAGRYARAALEALPLEEQTLWQALAPVLAPTSDVRAALALVEADPAILGIVYGTDARTSPQVRVLLDLPPAPGHPILYHAAVLAAAPEQALAHRFLAYLGSAEVQALAARRGFVPPPPAAR